MAIKSEQEYRERVSKLRPKLFIGGRKVEDLNAHPVTRSVIEATARVYELTLDPRYQDTMQSVSHLTGEPVSRALHIHQSREDLLKRLDMARLSSQKLGTCNYRCPGNEMLPSLASTTWEIDQDKGTEYHQRFNAYLKYAQENDLVVSGSVTDPKGDRSKRPLEQDPDYYVHVVEKRPDGIVVSGAKQHATGAYAADETLVLPGISCRKGEEDYALAFVIPNGAEGVTYIGQYNAFSTERESESDLRVIGNPVYGQRETCLVVFDRVFVPWERVFMCGEVEYTQKFITRFAKTHRMNCGGACKVGFMDLIIGATQLIAEYNGLPNVSHIAQKITRMLQLNDTSLACATAAAFMGKEEPAGSGVFMPDEAMSNIAKLNTNDGFWEVMALAGDIAGGVSVTMPSEKELDNPETRDYVMKYLGAAAPAHKRMRIIRFLQNWVAGLHGVGTYQGSGPSQNQIMVLYRIADLESRKRMAEELANVHA
ncbi:4-hydroxyphenylacetate 3-hydroxylase N-terminal domain-containing protein [Desulfatiglans anilini]|uniref:4-hydroxyphenylacetate 3-hydroxylase N-terminal domain-containing protein n=1 Tax=Desulfatiglans anilini TaxID=90728 RepID=UPI00040AF91A|nr:4-hydroxyphenylacetate 3-hydroxylase N-terminal domain-containing protein [Desulfatiglans anilini]